MAKSKVSVVDRELASAGVSFVKDFSTLRNKEADCVSSCSARVKRLLGLGVAVFVVSKLLRDAMLESGFRKSDGSAREWLSVHRAAIGLPKTNKQGEKRKQRAKSLSPEARAAIGQIVTILKSAGLKVKRSAVVKLVKSGLSK